MRYREMINRCLNEKIPFGVTLIKQGGEVGGAAQPYLVGTAAHITRVERHEDDRMDIVSVGAQRFKVLKLDESRSYLCASVQQFPPINGQTRQAHELAQRVRPRIVEYVELLSEASKTRLELDRLPEDPTTLAFLVAISLQIGANDKQKLLEMASIPEMLAREVYLLSREKLFTQYMINTQQAVLHMNSGPTGYLFPN
jgi:Lon protease-like protein